MRLIRVFHKDSIPKTSVVNGRSYTCAAGAAIDVPDADGVALQGAGWQASCRGYAGASSARPTDVGVGSAGLEFLDSTLGITIVYDNFNWRNPATGAIV
jgi:hypothetical protein